jgi:hypothetical protein
VLGDRLTERYFYESFRDREDLLAVGAVFSTREWSTMAAPPRYPSGSVPAIRR